MRAYFIQNMYLQGIHAGIQSQHTTVEMFLKYQWKHTKDLSDSEEDKAYVKAEKLLNAWAYDHKTTIILNGGYASNLREIVDHLEHSTLSLPWAYFEESKEALEGCITNIGIIVPEYIYNAIEPCEENDFVGTNLTPEELWLKETLGKMRLMS